MGRSKLLPPPLKNWNDATDQPAPWKRRDYCHAYTVYLGMSVRGSGTRLWKNCRLQKVPPAIWTVIAKLNGVTDERADRASRDDASFASIASLSGEPDRGCVSLEIQFWQHGSRHYRRCERITHPSRSSGCRRKNYLRVHTTTIGVLAVITSRETCSWVPPATLFLRVGKTKTTAAVEHVTSVTHVPTRGKTFSRRHFPATTG